MLILLLSTVVSAEWQVYDASVLPKEAEGFYADDVTDKNTEHVLFIFG